MNLFVAIGMNQDTVLCVVCAPQRFVDDVVVMPTCYLCHWLVTDRADAALFLPQVRQPTSSSQGLLHLYAEALFKIEFPCRVVGVACPLYLCCTGLLVWEAGTAGFGGFSVLVFCRSKEAPVLVSDSSKVAVLHPSLPFRRMSPPCPSPQGLEDGRIDMDKGFFGCRVSVKVCPSPYFGIECRDQPVCRGRFIIP